ncbi:hypothetical protein [Flectobacillus rivi]|uniref:HNH domain-containing protein n=1 Tax=Flectobacillus rivi TaxID=2984209 RepID=A0ABT6Z5U0_9BACT|nr:hypothetical protein [Flectobacillus rivi]MDI9876497.1 hypothetical protein [Flectobacillus rivi]
MISISDSKYAKGRLEDRHANALIEYMGRSGTKYNLDDINALIAQYFSNVGIKDIKDLLCASPKEITSIVNTFDQLPIEEQMKLAGSKDKKGCLDFTSLYDTFTRKNNTIKEYDSDKLIEDCDILTCPYCNENYTYRIVCSKDKKSIRRTFDWDHLFPKEKYPFLAVSFYNLVPSCKVCNSFKNADSKLFFNPFENVNVDDVYSFNFSLDAKLNTILEDKETSKDQNIPSREIIEFKTQDLALKKSLEALFESVKLKDRMKQHKGVINLVVERAKMYNETLLKGYGKQFADLGLNGFSDEMKAVYWGIELDHHKYYLKPFSKLTNDLIKVIL